MYAGKYYYLTAGDPGLGGFLKKAVGGVGKFLSSPVGMVATTVVPGGLALKALGAAGKLGKIGAVASRVVPGIGKLGKPAMGAVAGYTGTRALTTVGSRAMTQYIPGIAGGAALGAGGIGLGRLATGAALGAGGAMALSGTGQVRRRYRRMNPLNPKAARRAIRRIKAVRKLTRQIESQLPKRACAKASPFARRKR